MKAVSLLLNSYLPEDLRNYDKIYDVKDINKIMHAVATKYPEKYAEITKKISDLGRTASYMQGETITLKDLEAVIDKEAIMAQMQEEIKALPKDENFTQARRAIFSKYTAMIEKETAANALKNRNNIAMSVLSGARGKMPQLRAMISPVGTYSDYRGVPIDVYAKESFAEGIRPATFLASTFGSRASVISTKCIHKNTHVRMADLSVKMIMDIVPGEEVLGADKDGTMFPVKVLNVFDQGKKDCYTYRFYKPDEIDRTTKITCTEDHKFLMQQESKDTFEVIPFKELKEEGINPFGGWVYEGKEHVGNKHCYDIEVDHPDHLFVLANGMITSNSSTAKGGDLAKQFASTAADLIVQEEDCGTDNGLSLELDDPSLKGRVLAHDVDGFKAGSFITRDMLHTLGNAGRKRIVARSPITCSCSDGLCAKCVGKLYKGGKLPKVGDAIGLTASSTTMEPVTQMALCLVKGTKVRLASGGSKSIERIKHGDLVLAAEVDEQDVVPTPVLDIFFKPQQFVRKYTIDMDGVEKVVECTEQHKFMTCDRLMNSRTVLPINVIYTKGLPLYFWKDNEFHEAYITKASGKRVADCYDIEIGTLDHLFVLSNGIITSNSAKHTAGMTKDKRSYSGLEIIQQFTQSPEKFKDIGVVSELDGTVDSIEEAPQGGTFVTVSGEKHYIPAGHTVEVKQGQKVEAGDQLAEGLVDAEDVVRLKGLGAGRKYYADRLNKILEDSGAKTDKRNTEILARAAIRHVRVTNNDGLGNYLPDDIVDYNALQKTYVPDDVQRKKANQAIGYYLAKPALHYSIGTRITPSVAKELEENEYEDLDVTEFEPEFSPEMIRLRASSHSNPDWLASLGTSYLSKQLNEASTRGDDTNVEHNKDYRPRIMYGKDFGKNVTETGEF